MKEKRKNERNISSILLLYLLLNQTLFPVNLTKKAMEGRDYWMGFAMRERISSLTQVFIGKKPMRGITRDDKIDFFLNSFACFFSLLPFGCY